ncbi:reverse transcriptase domain-containing protein [Tanacetum coccineum]
MACLYRLSKFERSHLKGSFSFTLHGSNAGKISREQVLLFSRWIFQIFSNSHLTIRSRKDHFHLPLWNLRLQAYAFWSLQSVSNFSKVYDCNFSGYARNLHGSLHGRFLSVWRFLFDSCLNNLEQMLIRCKQAYLVLNWEKCHFMVTEGIVLGHKVSCKGLEVDKAKIDVIAKLPPPTNIKVIRSFLGHARLYRRFIKDFSKIYRPMMKLLEKDSVFNFDEKCNKAFETLKEKLTNTPITVSPNWSLPFELMCDASDFVVGAVLGQRE